MRRGSAPMGKFENVAALAAAFKRKRRRDVVLGVGVANHPGELDFFVMSASSLNTFSEEEARHSETLGHRIEKCIKIPVITVNEALKQCNPIPDFVSIDVEGLDEAVVSGIDFGRFRPAAFCVETLTYSEHGQGQKRNSIFETFSKHGFSPMRIRLSILSLLMKVGGGRKYESSFSNLV